MSDKNGTPESGGLLRAVCDLNGKLYVLLSLCVLFLVPLRIIGYNFNPPDDVNRHVAMAVSGRSWSDILVTRPEWGDFDHNAGWHRILAGLHALGLDKEGLRVFSIVALAWAFLLTGQLFYARAPLAWGLALLLAMAGYTMPRLFLGRPYLVSATVLLVLLASWKAPDERRIGKTVAAALLIAFAAWTHGAWHLFVLFPVSLALARRWRDAAWAAGAWLAGSGLAAAATGRPVEFLYKQLLHSALALATADSTQMLVSEFQPAFNLMPAILAIGGFVALRMAGIPFRAWLSMPAPWMALLGWTLGMYNGRFWHDWGAPAFILVLAEFARVALDRIPRDGGDSRAAAFGAIALAALYLGHAADIGSRWNNSTLQDYLREDDPAHAGWLPDPGGILYSDNMLVYYDTFFANPNGRWRYMLGHEAGLMPEEDLRIYREIQKYRYDESLLKPWVERMRPEDRLVLIRARSAAPDLPDLEWKYAAYNTWVGRLPRSASADDAPAEPMNGARAPRASAAPVADPPAR